MHIHSLFVLLLGLLVATTFGYRINPERLHPNMSLGNASDLPFPENYANRAPLFVVYHLTTMGRWYEVSGRQIRRLKASGLFEEPMFKQMYVLVLGAKSELGRVEGLFEGYEDKVTVVFFSRNLRLFEYPSTLKMRELAHQHPTSKLLYFHSKGVTREAYVDEWAMFMEYFLFDHYDRCLWKLDRFDAVGSDIATNPNDPFFMGNFWWASAKHLNQLPTPFPGKKYEHERIIFRKPKMHVWSFFESYVFWYKNTKREYNITSYLGKEVGGHNFTISNSIRPICT